MILIVDKNYYLLIFSLFWTSICQGQLLLQKNYFDEQNRKVESVISISVNDSTLEGPYLAYYPNGHKKSKGFIASIRRIAYGPIITIIIMKKPLAIF